MRGQKMGCIGRYKPSCIPYSFGFFNHRSDGEEAEKFHKRLAALISEKRMTPYSDCMSYLRRKLSFCLLRTVLAALRGYRGKAAKTDDCNMDINLLNLNEVVRY